MEGRCRDAYLAGLIDGEACIGIYPARRDKRLFCTLSIGALYKPVLISIQEEYGGRISKHSSHPNNKFMWRWEVRGSEAARILITIAPYLHEKRIQADLLIDYMVWKEKQPKLGIKWDEALWMVQAMKDLKRITYE